MDCILVVDAGGTKCDAMLMELNGHIRGFGHHQQPGVGGRSEKAALDAVTLAVDVQTFDTLYLSWIGPSVPIGFLNDMAAAQCRFITASESEVAKSHANVDEAVVLLAGTGAFVNGTMNGHAPLHYDGNGPILGDFGSGYHIGIQAIQAFVRSGWHERHATSLRKRLAERFHVNRPIDLVGLNLIAEDRSLVASLARMVDEEAAGGDRIAQEIIARCSDALAETFYDVVTALDLAGRPFTAIGTGSVIRCSNLYWQRLRQKMSEQAPHADIVRLEEPPVISVGIHVLRHLHGDSAQPCVERLLEEYHQRIA